MVPRLVCRLLNEDFFVNHLSLDTIIQKISCEGQTGVSCTLPTGNRIFHLVYLAAPTPAQHPEALVLSYIRHWKSGMQRNQWGSHGVY